jgi:hypothetical protein
MVFSGENLGNVERFEGVGTGAALGRVLEPLGMNDRFEVEKRAFK